MKKIVPFLLAITVLAACNGNNTEEIDPNLVVPKEVIAAPQQLTFTIENKYPHDTAAFTEGLQIYKGKMYEGTGDYENSTIQIADIKTGKVLSKHKMGTSQIFGEGINVFKGKIYQLTWKNNIVYVYNENDISKPIKELKWPYDGWGMTNNGTDLIIGDGTANLYFVNPDDFSVKNTIQVRDNTGFVSQVNELEYIDGYIYANVWQTNVIIKIDPANGHVVGRMVLPDLPNQHFTNQIVEDRTDVLNGIAWDSTTKKMYITGKRWPYVFEGTVK